jgi:dolichyl-phosphate-mannose--protein O-mannosyl transferase
VSHFWRLFTPNAVVFDEVHFKHFAGHYFAHTFYFDVHPPLANLLYAAVARIGGVPAETLLGDAPVLILRVLPALCGTLIAPLGYVLLRQLGAARRVALLAGIALLFENALLVDTRLALDEPMLICAGLAAIVSYMAARRTLGVRRWMLLAISGLLAGMALSFKWTGASALGMILALWAADVWRSRRIDAKSIGEASVLVAIPVAVYVATFAVHFALLTHVGEGEGYMSIAFHRTLVGDPRFDSTARMSLLTKMADLHAGMRRGNIALERTTHPASSPWYTWPVMKHPIAMWENGSVGPESKQIIALLGNPVVWWAALIGVVGAIVCLLRRAAMSSDERFALAFLAGCFAINYAPFMLISRVMYLYHYLFALVFAVLLAAYWFGLVAGWNDDSQPLFHFATRRSALFYWGFIALVVVSFVYFLPLSYGWAISQTGFDHRFWVLHPQL